MLIPQYKLNSPPKKKKKKVCINKWPWLTNHTQQYFFLMTFSIFKVQSLFNIPYHFVLGNDLKIPLAQFLRQPFNLFQMITTVIWICHLPFAQLLLQSFSLFRVITTMIWRVLFNLLIGLQFLWCTWDFLILESSLGWYLAKGIIFAIFRT